MESAEKLHNIEIEASRWRVLLSSGEATIEDRVAFNEWLGADPRHEEIYQDADCLWQAMAGMNHLRGYISQDSLGEQPPKAPASPRRRSLTHAPRRYWKIAGYAAAALLLLAVSLWHTLYQPASPPMEYATRVAETRDFNFADGSVVTLGARSKIRVRYDESERRVALLAGEAFFSVTKDPERPFVVVAGNRSVKVLGTKFDVHHGPAELRVSVQEGAVEVVRLQLFDAANPLPEAATYTLTAGQQMIAPHNNPQAEIRAFNPDQAGSWRTGRLIYDNTHLGEVIADANRYSTRRITLAGAGLAQLKVTGSYRIDRIEQMVKGLPKILPVSVESGPTSIVVQSRSE